LGLAVIADSVPDHAGPLAGVQAGPCLVRAQQADLNYVVTVAGDTPFFPTDLVQRFLAALLSRPTLVVARSDEGVHPVFGLWPIGMAPDLEKALKQGMRKVGAWAKQQGAVEVYFPKVEVNGSLVDPFFNISGPENLAEAEALLTPQRLEALKD
jgi:molybdopterin-guanine dinucleotide biosynthesis protein A